MTGRVGTAVHLTDDPVGSDGWAEARRSRINGSEIAAVLGLSPFESTFSLWHRKAGALRDVDSNDVMYWGTRIEPLLRDEWNLRHPELAVTETGQWRHHARTWQGGSPDGLGDGRLWEAKTARYGDEWGEPGTDEIPLHYRCQTLWYLDVFGFEQCDVSVLITGSDYREYVVTYDPTEAEFMRLKAEEFLATLDAGTPPPLDGSEATYEAVRELHPDIEPREVELSPRVALPYLHALAACTDAEAEKRRTGAAVIEAMGAAQHATYSGDRVASRLAPKTEGRPPYLRAVNGAADRHRGAA